MDVQNCVICNIQLTRVYDHYGCRGACFSCRNFFRRAVVKSQSFQCRVEIDENGIAKECIIDSKNRTSCKNCRYERCLKAGMNPNWVFNNQARDEPTRQSFPKNIVIGFTTEEQLQSQNLESSFNEGIYVFYFSMFSREPSVLIQYISHFLNDEILPCNVVDVLLEVDRYSVVHSAENLPIFDGLTQEEKLHLLHANAPKVVALMWAAAVNYDDTRIFIENLMNFGFQNPTSYGVDSLLPLMQQFQVSSKPAVSAYDKIFSSPWASDAGIEEQHFELSKSLQRWCRNPNNDHLDIIQLSLVNMIIFLNTEDTQLSFEQKKRIERQQMKYLLLFHRYLKSVYPKEAQTRFAGGIMALQYSKELLFLHSCRLKL